MSKTENHGASRLLSADIAVRSGSYGAGILQSGVRDDEAERVRKQKIAGSARGRFK
jgi:hypothetical protein